MAPTTGRMVSPEVDSQAYNPSTAIRRNSGAQNGPYRRGSHGARHVRKLTDSLENKKLEFFKILKNSKYRNGIY